MVRYFLKRFILLLPTLLAILLAVFLLLSVTNPSGFRRFGIYSSGYEQGETDLLDRLFEKTDAQPNLLNKYLRYCYDLLIHGEFGSADTAFEVSYEIFYRLRLTLIIAAFGLLVSLLVGVPLGFTAALNSGGLRDKLVSMGSLVLASIPSYTLAVLLMVIFTLNLHWLPLSGMVSWRSFVMPILVVSAAGIALVVKMTRSSVLEVCSRQYVTVLKAKGLSNKSIVYRHILKNSCITIASAAGNLAAQLLCGTLIAENFFAIPGIGQLVFRSITRGEQAVILGTIAVLSVLLMSLNILSDLACALISPRIRAGYSAGKEKKA